MREKKSVSMKAVVLLMVVVLLIGGAVGGTLAWLVTGTNTITNTFTVGDINIDLTETVNGKTESALTSDVANNNFKMVPGTDLIKDPKVTVKSGSESCWLFVEVKADNGVVLEGPSVDNAYITYKMASGWNPVDGATGVYYRKVNASTSTSADADQEFEILDGNKVHVLESVTKEMMEAAKTNKPSLSFAAYAIQSQGLKNSSGQDVTSASAAWNLIKTTGN